MKLVELKVRNFPEALKKKIKKDAKDNGRSMNNQVIAVLKDVYKQSA